MERKIRAYKSYFTDFITSISVAEARKVFFVIDMLKMQERLSSKFVKHVEDGIYELRAEHRSKIQWLPEEIAKDAQKRDRTG